MAGRGGTTVVGTGAGAVAGGTLAGKDRSRRCGRRAAGSRTRCRDLGRCSGRGRGRSSRCGSGGAGLLLYLRGQQRGGARGVVARLRALGRRRCGRVDRCLRLHRRRRWRAAGGHGRAIARPFDHQLGFIAFALHLWAERRHRFSEVENDTEGPRHRLSGTHRRDHAQSGRHFQVAYGAGVREIDHQAVRSGQRQGLVTATADQRDLGTGAGGAGIQQDLTDFTGPRTDARQTQSDGGTDGNETVPRAHGSGFNHRAERNATPFSLIIRNLPVFVLVSRQKWPASRPLGGAVPAIHVRRRWLQ